MSAFAKTLESKWGKNSKQQAKFSRASKNDFKERTGQLAGHDLFKLNCTQSTVFKIMQILYLDAGAFVFASRSDLTKGITLPNSF